MKQQAQATLAFSLFVTFGVFAAAGIDPRWHLAYGINILLFGESFMLVQ